MISYMMAMTGDGREPPSPKTRYNNPHKLKEMLRTEKTRMATEVTVDLCFEGRVFAHCVTIVAEVLSWDIEKSALPRPTLARSAGKSAMDPLRPLPLMEPARF